MFVSDVVGFDGLVNKELVASHVLVSDAHVDVMVDHNSAKEALVLLVSAVEGFELFTSGMINGWIA